jgi:hypothetical protein
MTTPPSTLDDDPSTTLEPPEALDREKALTLTACAAVAWCARGTRSGRDLVERLMQASAWASRARRHHDLAPLLPNEIVSAFDQPVDDWLPGGGGFALVEDGEPSAICLEIADAAGTSTLAEVEQSVIRTAMTNLNARADRESAYTTFRRFLVENAYASQSSAALAVQRVGLELGRVYGRVPEGSTLPLDGTLVFYPCPRCRWPMAVRGDAVSCHRSIPCLKDGARFVRRGNELLALGRHSPPEAICSAGMAALRPGVWRYTVLPGLVELDLAERLTAIPDVTVALWPDVDAYDLDVQRREVRWRIDVKDHRSALGLARHLAERPCTAPTWIVVPDDHADQVPILRRLVPAEAGYTFASVAQLVRLVRGAA